MKLLIMQSSPACLLGPYILLRTLYSHILNLCPALSVTDQVSHPYKKNSEIAIEKLKKI
jgi:hypothetical protein